mmetsp:Transcript_16021/g.48642  ORF Transcript_16021/g.48642 Transcript_16021/m.48642 type:complete len:236 (+) Transcript_16021:347-1054(+)
MGSSWWMGSSIISSLVATRGRQARRASTSRTQNYRRRSRHRRQSLQSPLKALACSPRAVAVLRARVTLTTTKMTRRAPSAISRRCRSKWSHSTSSTMMTVIMMPSLSMAKGTAVVLGRTQSSLKTASLGGVQTTARHAWAGSCAGHPRPPRPPCRLLCPIHRPVLLRHRSCPPLRRGRLNRRHHRFRRRPHQQLPKVLARSQMVGAVSLARATRTPTMVTASGARSSMCQWSRFR